MHRSRAQFRANRLRVGLSQLEVARKVHCSVETVKKWEKPNGFPPSAAAWDYLEAVLALHVEAVESAVNAVHEQGKALGHRPEFIQLTLWRSQKEYNSMGRDAGNVHIVNARVMEVAAVLESQGYEVRFRYPGGEA